MPNLWSDFIFDLTIRPRMERVKRLLPNAKVYPCGSRYVCMPPVLTTDIDFLVYSETEVGVPLMNAGYELTPFKDYGISNGRFFSYRKGVINLIVTADQKFAEQHNMCTHFCRLHNVRNKFTRVMIYEIIRENADADVNYLTNIASPKVISFLRNMKSPHREVIYQAYRAKHGVTE